MIRLKTLGTIDLRDEQGAPLVGNISRAKRLALLAYLGAQAQRFHRRDTLMALFWPDADAERARHALRQAVYVLRQALGPDAIVSRGEEELAVSPDHLWVDARVFLDLMAEGKDEAALELYAGEFLPGFHVPDASPELEEWLERERSRLRGLAAEAAWRVARTAARKREPGLAARWGRWAAGLTPLDEPAQRQLIEFLGGLGDRTGALVVYQQLVARLARELGTTPTAATRALAEHYRLRVSGPAAGEAPQPLRASVPEPPSAGAPTSIPPARSALLHRPLRLALGAVAILILALLLSRLGSGRNDPLLAVGQIEIIGPADTLLPPAALASLLATSVARLPGRRVLSGERVSEVAAQLHAAGGGEPTLSQAARQAGAEQLVEGTLSRAGPADSVRLALRVVDLRTGALVHTAEAQASDPFDLVDRATSELARQFGVTAPETGIAEVETGSPEAYGLYQEGLRQYYRGDLGQALSLFKVALSRDSTFAMAAFYAWRAAHAAEDTSTTSLAPLCLRLSRRAPTLERLWIQSLLLQGANSPSWVALADSLATLNPANLDGLMLAGDAREVAGDFLAGIPYYRRVAEDDSLSLGNGAGRCAACEARRAIIVAYEWADSLPAAEREARAWLRRQPGSPGVTNALWEVLRREGRLAAAAALGDSIAASRNDPSDAALRRAQLALTRWDFPAADQALQDLIRSGGRGYRDVSMALLATSLRAQGRLAQALRLVTDGRLPDGTRIPGAFDHNGLLPHREVTLIEMGEGRRAGAAFDSIVSQAPLEPGHAARHRVWNLTHLATALASAGDTTRLSGIADTIAALGSQSSYGRDRRLTYYVRGLLAEARGDTARARDLLERAQFSPTEGYAQIGYRLAQCDLALHSAPRAITALEAIFRGPYDSGNLYLNRTTARALLARAFAEAGQADSARIEYQRVERALSHSDPAMRGIRLEARQWLAAHPSVPRQS